MAEASKLLALSEAGARRDMKAPKGRATQHFPAGMEFEILNADAVVLLGLTHALGSVWSLLSPIIVLNVAAGKLIWDIYNACSYHSSSK
jgi:hypothetical protein